MNNKVAIIYLCWSSEPYKYLEDALVGIQKQTYSKEKTELLVVYNSHKEDEKSALPFIEQTIDKYKEKLPHVTILPQSKNLGFVGGNNVGMQWAIDNDFDYVFLHNGDGVLEHDSIHKLVNRLNEEEKIGAVQSLILFDNNRKLINNAGNNLHYLGLGYCNLYKKNIDILDVEKKSVGYLSGAALMMRVSLLKEHGLWDEDLFIYHDDLEYSLRLRILGYGLELVSDSVFYHKYDFSRNKNKYYLIERNRYAIMLMYLKIPTLLILLPMAIIMEVGLLLFAFKDGWLKVKIQVYKYWLKGSSWSLWLKKRKRIQSMRKRSDSYLLDQMVGTIKFSDIDNWLLSYIGNPLLYIYFYIIKLSVFW